MGNKDYILKTPSEESRQIRKESGQPFQVLLSKVRAKELQSQKRLSQFYRRMEELGIVHESQVRKDGQDFYRKADKSVSDMVLEIYIHDHVRAISFVEEFKNPFLLTKPGALVH